MGIFDAVSQQGHEQVVFCADKDSGLKAIIAVHDTTLGPALGGCRMWPYESEQKALDDVLRLSRGMTYKAASVGLNLGGGKAVIIGNSKTMKSEQLFRSFGRFVDTLAGRYITAQDVGTSVRDINWMRMETRFVAGTYEVRGGSGDPSPITAFGVFQGIRAVAKWTRGKDSLDNVVIAVQGLGHVGFSLVSHLVSAGAKVIATDIDTDNIRAVKTDFPQVEIVPPESIFDVPCDIFAPCALGAVINPESIARLKCLVVAGAANNVLADEERDSAELQKRGILYAPDFVINAGGLINVANELDGYRRDNAMHQTEAIYDSLLEIFRVSVDEKISTLQAAKAFAERRIFQASKLSKVYTGVSKNWESHRFF